MISIVIPLYNKERQIAKTLNTVLGQTFQDFEVVIVNDGSTDGSVEAVKQFDDPRIRLIDQPNGGVSAARNRGIAEARGEFVAFLDADDEWMPDYLETQHRLTEKYRDCDVFATNYVRCSLDGIITPVQITGVEFDDDGVLSNYFEIAIQSDPPLWTSAVIVRKSAIESIGGFPVGIKSGEDLLTWSRLACKYKIAYCRSAHAQFNDSADDGIAKPILRLGGELFIATELIKLYESENNEIIRRSLKKYIVRWFKIWGVILIEAKKNHQATRVALSGLKWGGKLSHFIPLLVLSILPSSFAQYVFYKLR